MNGTKDGRRMSRMGRLGAALVLALGAVTTMAAVAPDPARAAGYPYHHLEKVWCGGGGNSSWDWNFIQPYIPQIYAYNTRAGVVEYQNVAYHFRLWRLVNGQWKVDPQAGAWTPWKGFTTFDTDYPGRWLGGTYTGPTDIKMRIPQLNQMYAVSFQAAWHNATSGSWTFGPETWSMTHINLINGSTPIADRDMGYFGCDYYPDQGNVYLPGPIF